MLETVVYLEWHQRQAGGLQRRTSDVENYMKTEKTRLSQPLTSQARFHGSQDLRQIDVSELTNDAGYLVAADVDGALSINSRRARDFAMGTIDAPNSC